MFSKVFVTLALAAVALAVPAPMSGAGSLAARSIVDCADPTQNAVITEAYNDAHALCSAAIAYIDANGATDPLFVAYFKTNTAANVRAIYEAILNETKTNRLRCGARSPDLCPGNNAYTMQPSGNIYFCSPFYNLADQSALCGTGSLPSTRSGTMLHELSHAIAHTADISSSCSGSQSLAAEKAIDNATTFSCFARQAYRNTAC